MNKIAKNKKWIIFISLIVAINVYSQQKRNYQEEYKAIAKSNVDEKNRSIKQKEYFNSLQNKELSTALREISKLGDANFIAYDLLTHVKTRFEDKEFRMQMINELVNESNSTDYKIVLIDFLEKKTGAFLDEAIAMDDTYYSISKDKKAPDNLRQIASSKVGVTNNHNIDKARVKELIASNEIPLINGAAKSIKRYVLSKELENEVDEWVDELIGTLEKNKVKVKELYEPITVLGYTHSPKARTYLLNLFNDYKKTDAHFAESIVYSLSNNADTTVLNSVITEFRQNKIYDNFGSELTLRTLANFNIKLVEQLHGSNSEEGKINYLRSIKYINEPADKNVLVENCKTLLNNPSEEVRLESVKTLRFLLSYDEEQKILREHLRNEKSLMVKNEIYTYIGR